MQGIYSQYLSDPEITSICSDVSFIEKMLEVEIALATSQAKLGIIPKAAAKEISLKLQKLKIDPKALAEDTLKNGIPTIPLLAFAKSKLSANTKDYLHWGATSQDIIDTANVLIVKEALQLMEKRLIKIIKTLSRLAWKHEETYMVARTRTQQAVPYSFGLKVANWVQPMLRHHEQLNEMKPKLLSVQFGGAAGNLAALNNKGMATAQHLAKALKLNYNGVWHNQRDKFTALSSWLAMVSGSLAKTAQDVLLLSQTEVGELTENSKGGGKSSTMPHKNNPVLSEAIVALSNYNNALASTHFHSLQHRHERDGASWILEWLTLPQMMITTGTILNHASTISQNLKVNKQAMRANLKKLNGLVFSEQASFILCQYMSRSKAKNKVAEACQLVQKEEIHLAKALEKLLPKLQVDWSEKLQASNYQGANKAMIQQILKNKK